jgi:hypothetical protein
MGLTELLARLEMCGTQLHLAGSSVVSCKCNQCVAVRQQPLASALVTSQLDTRWHGQCAAVGIDLVHWCAAPHTFTPTPSGLYYTLYLAEPMLHATQGV